MAKNILEELKERGLVKQTIYEEELSELLSNNKVVCYCGFDPTAESLHIGNLVALLTLRRMQMAGHTPIALVGGATGRIGDPSFRNDMRPMMTEEQRLNNVAKIKAQIESFFDPNAENKLIVVNNDDWIGQLKYVDFLNDVGIHFSVNRMLSHECFKSRMETGLSFLEFNYMPMQGYDFLHLFRNYNCVYELGGDDQWANIIAGVDLIRRKESKPAFASTIPLLTKADGTKMGKSAGGAVWLDGNKFSDYDFYQYIRNIEDSKVEEIFKMLTFLPLDEIKEICNVKGKEINQAKERLAYEVTKIVRGEENAKKAMEQAKAAFEQKNDENMLTVEIEKAKVNNIIDLLVEGKLVSSRGEAKRLIDGKGVKIDDVVVDNIDFKLEKDEFVLQKGKKSIQKVILK
ncbi:MAG: tyrosine--tRNA ligase [Clostridia bacterium]|nr:tyrosine--tRNA ligase [Clostridia bacterium]